MWGPKLSSVQTKKKSKKMLSPKKSRQKIGSKFLEQKKIVVKKFHFKMFLTRPIGWNLFHLDLN